MGFDPSLLLLKVVHHGAFKFTKKYFWRKCDLESHADVDVGDMVVEVLFSLVDRPIGEEFAVSKDGSAGWL